jgi:hypothetical protein
MSFVDLVGEERAEVFRLSHDKIYGELRKVLEYSLMRHNDITHFKFLDKLEWLLKQSDISEYDANAEMRFSKILKVAQAPLEEFITEGSNAPPQQRPTPPESFTIESPPPQSPIVEYTPPAQHVGECAIAESTGLSYTSTEPIATTNTASDPAVDPSTPESRSRTDLLAESKRKVEAARASGRFGDSTAAFKVSAKRCRASTSSIVGLTGPAPKVQKMVCCPIW